MRPDHRTPPEQSTTTAQLVDAAAHAFGAKSFIEEDGASISFEEFRRRVRIAAAALLARGFAAGERAAIWAPNMHQWAVAALAIQYAGGVLVTVNTRYKGAEAAQILRDGEVSILFCIGHFLGVDYPALLAQQDMPALRETVVIEAAAERARDGWERFLADGLDWLEAHGASALDARAAQIRGDSVSDLLFTSGTTGVPKGVQTGHRQNIETFRQWTGLLGLDSGDRYLVVNPFFHTFGCKAGILACLMRGTTLLPHRVFDAEDILARVQRESVTMLPGPPTLFQSMLAHPRRNSYDISSLKKATTGAAVIPVELITRMRTELGIDTVLTAYGLSECCGLATMCRRGDADEIIAQTSGRAIPGVEVRCIDADGKALPAGEAGEITVRGFNVMRGYLNDARANAETIDAEGWLHTGDIGVLDEAGNLRITDRLKDMFITGGFNCYPAEIEQQLAPHPDIAMCAVIGIPDPRMGEVAMAWVVPRSGARLSEAELIAWCRERMANYKVPRKVRFVAELPQNASGKILKTELRRAHAEQP